MNVELPMEVLGTIIAFTVDDAIDAMQLARVDWHWHEAVTEGSEAFWARLLARVFPTSSLQSEANPVVFGSTKSTAIDEGESVSDAQHSSAPVMLGAASPAYLRYRLNLTASRKLAPIAPAKLRPIEECTLPLRCPVFAERLKPSGKSTRFGHPIFDCDGCGKEVHSVSNDEEFAAARAEGKCVRFVRTTPLAEPPGSYKIEDKVVWIMTAASPAEGIADTDHQNSIGVGAPTATDAGETSIRTAHAVLANTERYYLLRSLLGTAVVAEADAEATTQFIAVRKGRYRFIFVPTVVDLEKGVVYDARVPRLGCGEDKNGTTASSPDGVLWGPEQVAVHERNQTTGPPPELPALVVELRDVNEIVWSSGTKFRQMFDKVKSLNPVGWVPKWVAFNRLPQLDGGAGGSRYGSYVRERSHGAALLEEVYGKVAYKRSIMIG